MLLRQGQNGVILNGAADGAALVWSAAAREWFAGTSTATPPSFPSVPAFAAADLSSVADRSLITVGTINDTYLLVRSPSAAVTAAIDGVNIVAVTGPPGAVGVRQFVANPQAWVQSAWFLDPAGNDANDGVTALTPLKTPQELWNRLRKGTINQNTLVTCAAGSFPAKLGQAEFTIAPGILVTVQGALTSTAPVALGAIVATNPATNTRGTAADAAGAFARGQRLRLTSGAASGAIAFCQGGTVAASAVVCGWSRFTSLAPRGNATPTIVEPVAGDSYVTDTYATTMQFGGQWSISGPGRIVLRDINFTSDPTSSFTGLEAFTARIDAATSQASVMFVGCQFDANCFPTFNGGCNVTQCSFLSNNTFQSGFYQVSECRWQGLLIPQFGCTIQATSRWTLDGGKVVHQAVSQIYLNACNVQAGATAVGGTCWEVDMSCFVSSTSGSRLWGPTSGYGTSIVTFGTGVFQYGTLPTLTGSTVTDATIGGVNFLWAALPATTAAKMTGVVLA